MATHTGPECTEHTVASIAESGWPLVAAVVESFRHTAFQMQMQDTAMQSTTRTRPPVYTGLAEPSVGPCNATRKQQ